MYDDVNLFPRLHRDFGELAVPLVMAHEWGHGIQDRAENDFQADVLKELQADCFAGAWVGYVANEGDPDIKVRGGNLDQAMTAMLEFRDPVGTASDEQGAHGSGFDRVTSLQAGFEGGPETCAPYFDTPPTIVEIPFTSEDDAASGGNLPPDEVIPAAVDTLNDFYANVEPLYVTKTADDVFSYDSTDEDNLPECGGTEQPQSIVKNRVFYCIDDGTFGYDEPYLQRSTTRSVTSASSPCSPTRTRRTCRRSRASRASTTTPTTPCWAPTATRAATRLRCSTT